MARREEECLDSLLCTSFCNTSGNDVGNYVARLDKCEKKLTDLSESADWIQISLSESTDAESISVS